MLCLESECDSCGRLTVTLLEDITEEVGWYAIRTVSMLELEGRLHRGHVAHAKTLRESWYVLGLHG